MSNSQNNSGSTPFDASALLLALTQQQQVLTTIVEALATKSTQEQVNPPVGVAPRIKNLPLPKLGSPDNITIPHFHDWIQRWRDYGSATQLHAQSTQTHHAVLRSALDTEWTLLWNSGRLQIGETDDLDSILQRFGSYLRRRRNPLLDRQEFHRRDQMPGETIDRYYSALAALDDACAHDFEFGCTQCAKPCELTCPHCFTDFPLYNYLREIRIRDRLICGLLDKSMQQKVLTKPLDTLSLEKVLSICTAFESSLCTGTSLSATSAQLPECQATTKSSYKRQQSTDVKSSNPSTVQFPCKGCGDTGHSRKHCPAHNLECEFCGIKGHLKKVCRKREQEAASKSTTSLPQNTALLASNQTLLPVTTTLKNVSYTVQWLPDTGAEIDAISLADLKQLDPNALKLLSPEKQDVLAANGTSLGPVGSINAVLSLNDKVYRTNLRVFRRVTTPLLSKRGCIALGLIDPKWPSVTTNYAISSGVPVQSKLAQPRNTSEIKEQLSREFSSVFDDTFLNTMTGPPMSIHLIEGATPTKRFKANSVPFYWRDSVKAQLDTLSTKGVIEKVPVGEPVDWCHPMVVVPKKGTLEPRITVDLTVLNKYVRRPAYPVAVSKEVVAGIPPNNCYFTSLDGRIGYNQVDLDEPSRKLTTFITPWGTYRFRRNVMGLISAGDEFNRRVDEAIQDVENTAKVVEDILAYDTNLDSYIQRVRQILERCKRNQITLNPKKFIFAQPKITWCGFDINSNGYAPASYLVSGLQKFPVTTCKTDVRSFCGLVQQFESFSHTITSLGAPIRSLLSKDCVFVWEATHQRF